MCKVHIWFFTIVILIISVSLSVYQTRGLINDLKIFGFELF
jgi:hypothetical protein